MPDRIPANPIKHKEATSDDYFNLGPYSRTVTTTSAEAQLWFDRGLTWCYWFNHEEAVTCFETALGYDPNCRSVERTRSLRQRGNHAAAFAHLRRSVDFDDTLPYDEPWAWMQPARHALGALLLEQGQVAEAEAVYRADFSLDGVLSRACQHPDNFWSLHGLHECLKRRDEAAEAVLIKQRLDLAMARADVPIMASCYCRMSNAA